VLAEETLEDRLHHVFRIDLAAEPVAQPGPGQPDQPTSRDLVREQISRW
jgi:hypothetical protein